MCYYIAKAPLSYPLTGVGLVKLAPCPCEAALAPLKLATWISLCDEPPFTAMARLIKPEFDMPPPLATSEVAIEDADVFVLSKQVGVIGLSFGTTHPDF